MADPNALDDQATSARLAGYGWDQISDFTDGRARAAEEAGYAPEEIAREQGQSSPQRSQDAFSAYWQTRLAGDDQLTSGLQNAPLEPLTPLDATSAQRIAAHAGTTAPEARMPETGYKPSTPPIDFNDSDARSHYADALLSGHVRGPLDFAERYAGAFLGAAGEHHDAAKSAVVRSASALADGLPTNRDLTDTAIVIAHGSGAEMSPAGVATVKRNLMGAWSETGEPLQKLYQRTNTDPEFAAQMVQPPVPPTPPAPWWQPFAADPEAAGAVEISRAMEPAVVQHFADVMKDWSDWGDQQKAIADRLQGKSFGEKARDPEALQTAIGAAFGALPANLEAKIAGVIRDMPMPKVRVVDPGEGIVRDVSANQAFAPEPAVVQEARALSRQPDKIDEAVAAKPAPEEGAAKPEFTPQEVAEAAHAQAAGHSVRGFLSDLLGDETGSLHTPVQQAARDAYRANRDYTREQIIRNDGLANQDIANVAAALEPHQRAVNKAMGEWERELAKGPAGAPMSTAMGQAVSYMEGRSAGVVLAPTSRLKPVADAIRDTEMAMDKRLRQQAADGIITYDGYVEDHFRHFWTDGAGTAAHFTGAGKLGESGGLRERSFPTIADGLAAGKELKYPNPLQAVMADNAGKILYSHAADTLDTMEKAGFLYRDFSARGDGDLAINHRIGERAIPMQKTVALRQAEADARTALVAAVKSGQTGSQLKPLVDAVRAATKDAEPTAQIQRLYGPPGVANQINTWLDKGLYQNPRSAAIYDMLIHAKNTTTGFKLLLPLFHAITYNLGSLASGIGQGMEEVARGQFMKGFANIGKSAIGYNLVENRIAGYKALQSYVNKGGDRIVQELTEAGMNFGGRQKMYEMTDAPNYATALRRGSLGREMRASLAKIAGDPKLEANLMRVVRVPDRTLGFAIREVQRTMKTLTAPVFDIDIPMVKAGAAYRRLQSFLDANPNASPSIVRQRSRDIVRDVDNRLGELNLDTTFAPKTVKQIANAATISTSWAYGSYRGFAAAAGFDIERGAFKWNPTSTTNLIGTAVVYAYLNTIMQYLHTGQFPWQTDTPFMDMANFRTGGAPTKGGMPERGMIPSELKELYDLAKVAAFSIGQPSAIPQGLAEYALAKANPFWGLIRAITTGQDAIGHRIAQTPGGWPAFLKDQLLPIFAGQLEQRRKGTGLTNLETISGIREAPKFAEDTPAYLKGLDGLRAKWEKEELRRAKRENADRETPDPTLDRTPSRAASMRPSAHGGTNPELDPETGRRLSADGRLPRYNPDAPTRAEIGKVYNQNRPPERVSRQPSSRRSAPQGGPTVYQNGERVRRRSP